ncbi:relaxase/mobilization nuclease domain-containing protein, partial [Hymenobacter frigidus]
MDEQTTIGKDFGGAVRYLFAGRRDQPSDKQAEILTSKGVNTNSVAEMIADFELGRDLNPRLNLAVWHTSLSFNPDDEARMSNARMRAIAEDYLKKMGLDNTQYIVVRHRDRPDHHHLHIVANRVDNAGESIADGRDFFHSNQALKELVKEHGLTSPGEPRLALQNPERFRPIDLARYNLRATLNPAVMQETQWPQLLATLKEEKIASKLHYNREGKATGISFEKDGYCFKGSALGPHLSLAGIDKQLAANELKQRAGAMVLEGTVAHSSRPLEALVTTNETLSSSLAETESLKAPVVRAPLGTDGLNAITMALSGPAASGQPGEANGAATAESVDQLTQAVAAVAAYQQEKNLITSYEAQAQEAHRTNELVYMFELNLEIISAAKQRMMAYETEANSTSAGRELLAELNDLQSGKVQKNESGLAAEGSAAAVPIPEKQASLPPAVESVVFVEAMLPLPVGPRQDAVEPATGTVTPLLVPTGADTSLPAGPSELPSPRTVGPNESLPLVGEVTAAKATKQSNPVTPTAPAALPAMSLADMLVSSVPEFTSAPAVAAPAVAAP